MISRLDFFPDPTYCYSLKITTKSVYNGKEDYNNGWRRRGSSGWKFLDFFWNLIFFGQLKSPNFKPLLKTKCMLSTTAQQSHNSVKFCMSHRYHAPQPPFIRLNYIGISIWVVMRYIQVRDFINAQKNLKVCIYLCTKKSL